MAPARVRLDAGVEALACVRLTEKGMFRWYCGQCKTPIGNTMGPSMPFVGLVHTFMDHGSDGRARDQVLGQPVGYVQTKSARGNPPQVSSSSLLRAIGRSVRMIGTWWLTGGGAPSPFFDADSRAPRVPPRILSADERRAL
jgi:hypothetical protein